jgi:hypothetical protein
MDYDITWYLGSLSTPLLIKCTNQRPHRNPSRERMAAGMGRVKAAQREGFDASGIWPLASAMQR